MNRSKPFLEVFITVIVFILLHNQILLLLSNISSLLREDNRVLLDKTMYEQKIESLERQLFEYESSYENLSIYSQSNYILSKIALRDVYDFYDYLIITPNTRVSKGSAVINESGLVGIVKDADSKSAKVSLISGKEKISVKIASSYGIMNGYDKKSKELIVRNINNYENIEVGASVMTSGLSNIDGDILIGSVSKVEKDGIENIVYVKPSVDLDNLNYLYVINKWYYY